MEKKSIKELERKYELGIDKIVKTIKKEKAKRVLLQFPDGLKACSEVIAQEIEGKVGGGIGGEAEVMVWLGSCFGACDVPLQVEKLGVDMIVQFGHSAWPYKEKDIKVL